MERKQLGQQIHYFFELVTEGIMNLKFLVDEFKREEICIKWWDQRLYDNTHLISHKSLEYYLLKKN